MTDSGAVLVGNAYAQSRSGASMIRHLLCGMLCAVLLLLPAAGRANPGDLDPTFGIGGKVTTGIGTDDYGYAVAIQADGKLVVAGETNNGINYDVALVRYNANGTLDATFGTGGKVTTAVGTSDEAAYALAIQADGKLVVAGETFNGSTWDFALVRYNANGTLDATFGTGGKVTTAVGTSDEAAYALAIQADGKLVAAGETDVGSNNYDFALVRYNANGALDPTFGTGGKVTTAIGTRDDVASAVAVQADGKLVAAGDTGDGGNNYFALARYNANGTLDATFGTGGKVTTAIGTLDYAYALAVRPDGKLVAAGETFNGSTTDFALARYNANGTLDPTFGTNGMVKTAIGTRDDAASALAIQADGKLVAAGETDNGTNYDFALARYFGSTTTSTTTTTLPSPCGDVNGDGLVDIADALIVAQYDVGLRRCGQPPFTNPAKCDVNQDASCTIGDALRMAQCDVGIVSCTFGCLPLACP